LRRTAESGHHSSRGPDLALSYRSESGEDCSHSRTPPLSLLLKPPRNGEPGTSSGIDEPSTMRPRRLSDFAGSDD
ncbi:hypothetical protein U1Q18_029878, partial [Sarracenia purpurea var. burkii]